MATDEQVVQDIVHAVMVLLNVYPYKLGEKALTDLLVFNQVDRHRDKEAFLVAVAERWDVYDTKKRAADFEERKGMNGHEKDSSEAP